MAKTDTYDTLVSSIDELVKTLKDTSPKIGSMSFSDEFMNTIDPSVIQSLSDISNKINLANSVGHYKLVEKLAMQYKVITDELKKQEKVYNSITEFQQEQKDSLKEITSKIFNWINVVWQGLADWKVALSVLGVTLYNKISDIGSAFADMAKNIGGSGEQMAHLFKETGGAALQAQFYGVSLEDSVDTAKALTAELGNVNAVTKEAILYGSKLVSRYGVGADSFAKLYEITKNMTGSTEAVTLHTFDIYKNIAETNGIPIQRLFEELATSSEEFALFTKDAGVNMAETAAYAIKLGVEFSDLTTIAKSLLDIQSSLEGEMNASILIGRQLNFNDARRLALAGDLEGMTKSILSQMGGINQFEKLNIIQKEAVADALGVEYTVLLNMVAKQKEAEEHAKNTSTWWGKTVDFMMTTGKGFYNFIKNNALWMMATLNLMRSMGPMWKGIKSAASGVGSVFSKYFSKGGDKTLSFPGAEESGVGETLTDKAKDTVSENTEKMGDTVGKMGKNAGNLLKGAAAMVLVAAALWVFAKALQEFQTISWEQIIKGAVAISILAGIVIGLGFAMNFAGAYIIAGAIAMLIIAGALWVLGKAIQEIATGMEKMGEFFNTLNTVDATNMLKVGIALLPLAAGIGLLTLASLGLYLALPALFGFAAVLYIMGAASSMLGEGLKSVTAQLSILGGMSDKLLAVGAAFMQMGAGMLMMAAGAIALLPVLPVVGAVLSAAGGSSGERESVNANLEELNAKVNTLIGMFSNGIDLKLDGNKIGTWISKEAKSVAY